MPAQHCLVRPGLFQYFPRCPVVKILVQVYQFVIAVTTALHSNDVLERTNYISRELMRRRRLSILIPKLEVLDLVKLIISRRPESLLTKLKSGSNNTIVLILSTLMLSDFLGS